MLTPPTAIVLLFRAHLLPPKITKEALLSIYDLIAGRVAGQAPCPVEWAQPVASVTDLRELLVASLIEREHK